EATPAEVMAAIADFDAYPRWASAVKETEIVSHGSDGRASEVRFELNAGPIKDAYKLAYTWSGDREVSWTLVQASVLKALDGSYVLSAASGGGTNVTYHLQVDVNMPMLGMLKRKAEKMIIDTALNELKKYVEQA